MKARVRLFLLLALWVLGACQAYEDIPTPTGTRAPTEISTSRPVGREVLSSPTPLPTCAVTTGVPSGYLNLRTGAGRQYGVITVLHEGQILTVFERADWLKVRTRDGLTGFIYGRYCT